MVNLYTKNKVILDYKETTSIEIYKAKSKINKKDFIIKIIDTPNNKQFLNIIKD